MNKIYQQKDGSKILDLISHRDHLEEFKNLSLGTFNEDSTKDKQFINTILELIDITNFTLYHNSRGSRREFMKVVKNFNIRVSHKSFNILWSYFINIMPVSFDSAIHGIHLIYRDIKIVVDESLKDYEYTLTETLMTNKSE